MSSSECFVLVENKPVSVDCILPSVTPEHRHYTYATNKKINLVLLLNLTSYRLSAVNSSREKRNVTIAAMLQWVDRAGLSPIRSTPQGNLRGSRQSPNVVDLSSIDDDEDVF